VANISAHITKMIQKYLAILEEKNIPIEKAWLFGSYASGTFNEWSDIDIALVSKAFQGVRMDDRNQIRRFTLGVSSNLEPLPYRPEDFSEADPFVREILRHGVQVK
jgi:uncharacterized protein